ncbi:MAG: S8 family serine peptidase [Oligoflexia bacterium]|nr:S8 family serine peptidase [Oligoflexia bacterium]
MLKLNPFKRVALAAGLLTTVGFLAINSSTAFGLVHNLKSTLSKKRTEPADFIVRNWGIENEDENQHSDIDARRAWKISKGSKKVKVFVIDTGIDPNHPDLKDAICKNSNGEYGYDFVTSKKNPEDKHGHGTHVAGILGATAKAKAGAIGVAPNICIMAVRYYSDTVSGAQNLANTVKAIHYAIDNGADIINYSGGGTEFSAAELKAIKRAEEKGILFVAAAGNEYENTDEPEHSYYPAAYGLSNIISVAATNSKNKLIASSNWGKKHVHVAAPGENIFSTFPKGRYGYLTGTSQATAFVTGIAALILSENPKLKPADVREIIMKSVDKVDSLEAKVTSGGKVNAYKALKLTLAKRDGANSKILTKLESEEAQEAKQEKTNAKPKRDIAFH